MPVMNVVKQDSLASEHISKSGTPKTVSIVVKNLAFHVELQANVSLTEIQSTLIYDFDQLTENKIEVSYVKSEPMEAKVHILDAGEKADVELKIKVLTSQHEDMLFRVRFTAIDPISKVPPFECFTSPIRVISKLTQLKKSMITISPNVQPKRKSPVISSSNDFLVTSLVRLEQQQQKQSESLELIMARLGEPTQPLLPLQTLSLASNLLQPDSPALGKVDLRTSQDGMRMSQDGIRLTSDLRASQDGMKILQDGMRISQDGMRTSQDGIRMSQDGIRLTSDIRASQEGMRISPDILVEDKRDLETAFRAFLTAFHDFPGEKKEKFQQLMENLSSQDMIKLYDFVKMFEVTFPNKKQKVSE